MKLKKEKVKAVGSENKGVVKDQLNEMGEERATQKRKKEGE